MNLAPAKVIETLISNLESGIAEFDEAPLLDRHPLFCIRVCLQNMVVRLGSKRIAVLRQHLFEQQHFVHVGADFMALSNHNFLPRLCSVPARLPSSNT